MIKGNAVVGQSGGPTAAINATLSGVIRGAENCDEICKIYGMKFGIEGLRKGDLVDLGNIVNSDETHFALECTPSAALGSCRCKLPDPEGKDTLIYEQIFRVFAEYDIRYFFYIGGNDSMDTVHKLSVYAHICGYDMRIIGVPKTVDNDLYLTDHTPGYGSAAKFVATSVQEIARDCSVYDVKAVTVVEIMGRDAGWLAAAAGLPRLNGEVTADLIYLPEVVFDTEKFISSVKAVFEQKPNIVVAVSEGIRFADGRYVGEGAQSGAADIFGHKYLAGAAKQLEFLIKDRIGCKVRSIELSLPQRCAGHLLSGTDISESVAVGKASVEAAVSGISAAVAVLERKCGDTYGVNIEFKSVGEIANKIKTVPLSGINAAGNNVTDELLRYIQPLIEGEISVPMKNGLPVHFKIK